MNESMLNTVTKTALNSPTSSAMPSTMVVAAGQEKCAFTCKATISTCAMPRWNPTDRSNWRVASGTISASASIAVTDWPTRMLLILDALRNVVGRNNPNATMTSTNTSASP